MAETNTATPPVPSLQDMQQGWAELTLRVGQLEAERAALAKENKELRFLFERVIDHRQKSHNELVLILTNLVSKLPLNDVGAIVARLVEHNTNVSQYLAALIKGTVDTAIPQPELLKVLENTKRELAAALKPLVEQLSKCGTPLEGEMLQSVMAQPETFFSPRVVRANRCFVKGYVARERVVREFGEEALVLFNDMTTDPKLNPNPKKEEIALSFKPDFERLLADNPQLIPDKRQKLIDLYQRVQRSKGSTEEARSQRNAFLKLSFILELLHFYENQSTEAPDAVFAQRLPGLVEQLVLAGANDPLVEKSVQEAELLLRFVVAGEHRQMVVNNIGKAGAMGRTLKYVLRFRSNTINDGELDEELPEFLRHLMPSQNAPAPEALLPVLRLIPSDTQRLVVKSILRSDRLRKADAETLGRALGDALGLKGLEEQIKADAAAAVSPELERQRAWARIKDMLGRRSEPAAIATAIRERLNAKYDADEIKQSWVTLTETDPISFIRVFCQLPYRADGTTDSVARTVMETYVTRLTHEKYAATYHKVANSLKNMFAAKPDSPTLVNFLALVRWISAEAAERLCRDIGMAAPVAS